MDSHNAVYFRVTGRQQDLQELRETLLAEPEGASLQFSESAPSTTNTKEHRPTRQFDLLELVISVPISFATSLAANSFYDWVRAFLRNKEKEGVIRVTEKTNSTPEASKGE